jgi:hypothetical protein
VESTDRDVGTRLARLERDFEELVSALPDRSQIASVQTTGDTLARLSFVGWLKVSGPTFAVMAVGFTLVWNAQLALSGQILGAQESLSAQILAAQADTNAKLLELGATVARLDATVSSLATQVDGLGQAVDRLAARLDALER